MYDCVHCLCEVIVQKGHLSKGSRLVSYWLTVISPSISIVRVLIFVDCYFNLVFGLDLLSELGSKGFISR